LTKTKLLLKNKPSKKEIPEIYKLYWKNTTPKTTHVTLDIGIQNEPSITNQYKFNASSLYKWNFDGMT
jgi:hypothetical protein